MSVRHYSQVDLLRARQTAMRTAAAGLILMCGFLAPHVSSRLHMQGSEAQIHESGCDATHCRGVTLRQKGSYTL